MNLYILDRTELADVRHFKKIPTVGDVIIYFRAAQDTQMAEKERLKQNGIEILQATDLLDIDCVEEIDAIGARFIRTWFLKDDLDVSLIGTLSLGKSYALEIARQCNPRFQIWYGEIIRRALQAYPKANIVFSDIENGGGIFDFAPNYFPFRNIICHVAQTLERSIKFLPSPRPLPSCFTRTRKSSWLTIVRGWASGLRPHHFLARIKSLHKVKYGKAPILYNFMGRGHNILGGRIAANGRFQVIGSLYGIEGTGYVRHDHLLALPRFLDVKAVWRVLRHIRLLSNRSSPETSLAELHGIDYAPFLAFSVKNVIRTQVWPFLFVVAQARKLQRITNFDALLLNGAGNEPMGTLAMLNQQTKCKIYLSPHGMNVHRSVVFGPVVDNPHVIYFTSGSSHCGEFCTHDTNGQAANEIPLGNSLTVLMNHIRSKKITRTGKRLLVLSFGHLDYWRADRIYACDQYYIDLFNIFRVLFNEGWSISLRAHPSHSQSFERKLAKDFSIEKDIFWDEHPSLNDALLSHDCVVSNITSAYYQSLYAGWPTIFYEPSPIGGLGPKDISESVVLTGVPTASDLERPATNTPNELLKMIRDSLEPKSMVSTFPKRFTGELATRFIGPDPEQSDKLIADFIERDFFSDTPM